MKHSSMHLLISILQIVHFGFKPHLISILNGTHNPCPCSFQRSMNSNGFLLYSSIQAHEISEFSYSCIYLRNQFQQRSFVLCKPSGLNTFRGGDSCLCRSSALFSKSCFTRKLPVGRSCASDSGQGAVCTDGMSSEKSFRARYVQASATLLKNFLLKRK
jgi:hypothetical protein